MVQDLNLTSHTDNRSTAEQAIVPTPTRKRANGVKPDSFHISRSMALAVRQISITLEEDLLQFLDQWGGNRSAAIAEAVRQWRDQQWQRSLAEAYAALDEAGADRSANPSSPDALIAAREAAELARSPS